MPKSRGPGTKRKTTEISSKSDKTTPGNDVTLGANEPIDPDMKAITADPMDISDDDEEDTSSSSNPSLSIPKLSDYLSKQTVGLLENCDVEHCVPLARIRDVSETGIMTLRAAISSKGYMKV